MSQLDIWCARTQSLDKNTWALTKKNIYCIDKKIKLNIWEVHLNHDLHFTQKKSDMFLKTFNFPGRDVYLIIHMMILYYHVRFSLHFILIYSSYGSSFFFPFLLWGDALPLTLTSAFLNAGISFYFLRNLLVQGAKDNLCIRGTSNLLPHLQLTCQPKSLIMKLKCGEMKQNWSTRGISVILQYQNHSTYSLFFFSFEGKNHIQCQTANEVNN